MSSDRRTFIRLSAAAGGALALGGVEAVAGATGRPLYQGLPDVPRASRTKRILILGGTGFTGPFQVHYAVARGHQVAVFNRGMRQADLPDGVEHLRGDRDRHELDALRGRSWDVVIDNPTTMPFWIRDAAEVLHESTGQYVMISSISVYDPTGLTRIDEDSPRHAYRDGDPLKLTMDDYRASGGALFGPMKTESENETLKWFGDRATIIRPGLIVGPRDGSFRFTYWPWRVRDGGEVLSPGDGNDPVQIIDARDLAEWTIRMVEDGNTGIYNATGPRGTRTMAEQLYGISAAFDGNREVSFTWVPADFLARHEVRPWMQMTTWFPPGDPNAVIARTDISRAVAKGLTFRPLATTAVDAVEWVDALPEDVKQRVTAAAGLPREREREVLQAWHRASPAGR